MNSFFDDDLMSNVNETAAVHQSNRTVLTKKTLLEAIEGIDDDTEIRLELNINDVIKAKRSLAEETQSVTVELDEHVIADEFGINVVGFVKKERNSIKHKPVLGRKLIDRERGVVKWFNEQKGLGFVLREDGQDVFVHYEAIRGDGFKTLLPGSEVEYTLFETDKGLQAQDVVVVASPEENQFWAY